MKKTILILFSVLFLNQQVLAVTLFEALTEAYKNNTDLNAERENINISEEDLRISKGNYLPTVTISGSKSQEDTSKLTNRSGVEQSVNDVDPSTQSIKIEQTLLDFGRNADVKKNEIGINLAVIKLLKKEQEVLGGKFDKNNYKSERVWATARDGRKVAISLVYHKDTELTKDTPLLQYAYGSYGYTISDGFSTTRLSLLDRGFVYAVAHIRGGQYLGREWYDHGKMMEKKNSFFDFIDCSKYLIENNYTSAKHLYAMGGSAGGLLMGAISNMNPELYNGIVAAVPFVDVISTMLDETIPLTTGEFDEWGNPKEKEAYEYMLSYSPYDQVTAKDYPNMLVTTGYFDSQVQYWEPAKWVAKLRELKTDTNILLLHTNMDVGHGGASGRFDSLKETAIDYTFLLALEDKL